MGAAMRAEWIGAIGREHVLQVAHALGLEVQVRSGHASKGSFACPACHAVKRHPKRRDPRLACGVRPGSVGGWHCHECNVSGDQLHLVAYALEGKRWDELAGEQKARVRTWIQEWTRTGETPSTTPARPRLELVLGADAPEYPPAEEVRALWEACGSVRADDRISRWLERERGLAVGPIASADLCVSLPWGTRCPKWACKPEIVEAGVVVRPAIPWSETAYRCLFPMFDHAGAMRNMLARYVGKPAHDRAPKSRAAAGYSRRGLVLADAAGRALLEGKLELGERALRLVIAEGEMDLLAFSAGNATVSAKAILGGELLAVLGIVSGSWTAELAARIPDGARVLVATHSDADGEKYARAIARTLADRMRSGAIRAERWRAR